MTQPVMWYVFENALFIPRTKVNLHHLTLSAVFCLTALVTPLDTGSISIAWGCMSRSEYCLGFQMYNPV